MSIETIKPAAVVFQIMLQTWCIWMAIRAYRDPASNGGRSFWYWFAGGAGFQLVRRLMYLVIMCDVPIPDLKFITFILVPTCVSVCYAMGMLRTVQYARKRRLQHCEDRKQITSLLERLEKND
jgi:hypothetical protein